MDEPHLRFGVISDIHAQLADDGLSLVPDANTGTIERALAFFRDNGADAVVVAGDFTDSGLVRELRAFADIWRKVFPDNRAPDGRKVERIFATGNHDAYGLANGRRVFQDEEVLRREAIQGDPQKAWRECFGEDYEPFFTKTVRGYDFFCAQWAPGIWCNGYAETGCSGCEAAFRGKMARCDPARPFFYVQHPHPAGTVYGVNAWGVDDGEATRLLSGFPQAVAFSGHSHEPLTNEKSIWRGAFTSVATGSLRYVSGSFAWNFEHRPGYENGICNYYGPGIGIEGRGPIRAEFDAPKTMPDQTYDFAVQTGLFVSVFDDRVEIARRDFASGLELGAPWIVPVPARPASFEERAASSAPPQFPAGAALAASVARAATRGLKWHEWSIEPEQKQSLRLDFPAATECGHVVEYEIAAVGGGERFATRICAIGGLYPPGSDRHRQPEHAVVALDRLPADAREISVAPLDSFGNRGVPLRAKLP